MLASHPSVGLVPPEGEVLGLDTQKGYFNLGGACGLTPQLGRWQSRLCYFIGIVNVLSRQQHLNTPSMLLFVQIKSR